MIPATELENRSPEEIQADIAQTRRQLDAKLEKLGERLDPRVRLHEIKGSLSGNLSAHAPQYNAWAAVAAVVAGTWMAVRGWRACRSADLYVSPDHPALDQTYGMTGSAGDRLF